MSVDQDDTTQTLIKTKIHKLFVKLLDWTVIFKKYMDRSVAEVNKYNREDHTVQKVASTKITINVCTF